MSKNQRIQKISFEHHGCEIQYTFVHRDFDFCYDIETVILEIVILGVSMCLMFSRLSFQIGIVCVSVFAGLVSTLAYGADETEREQNRFFEQHVRPLLVQHCFECHGQDKQKGDLRVDSIGALLAGGESGPAIVVNQPEESLLIEAVRYESYEMPPSGKLSDQDISILEKWVEMGAPWPGQERVASKKHDGSKITEADRAFWSFQPLTDPVPPETQDHGWGRNEIDRFIWAKLVDNDLRPTDPAPRETLLRRLYFDLIGLPPTPQQVDEFLSDSSPQAYEKLVEKLLASPRYGERWGRFWLDLVRYAESDGFRKDDYRPDAWRYRDYVIESLNKDKPYDQFVREQIAGDEIAPHDPEALAATGFLRHGIYEYNQRDARTQWQDMLNDITDTVGDTFLGMGMGCARCHDHKFDPILQKDYFRLQAFFANLAMPYEAPLATPEEIAEHQSQLALWEAATSEIRKQLEPLEQPKLDQLASEIVVMFPEDIQEMVAKPEHERTSYEKQICHLVELQVIDKQKTLATRFKGDEKKQWEALKKELAEFDHLKPKPLPTGLIVSDYGTKAPPVFIPSKERLGEIAPGFLTIFDPRVAHIEPMAEPVESTGRRTTLANWLTGERHPLTTRVIVNRIWKEHFGAGIVDSPSDFGHLGELPSHPQLLDWLATRFVENGWSLKWLHRQIVLSATYRQHSLRTDEHAEKIDPENRLLWRFNVRRLTAEQIRDAQLVAAGVLDERAGGPGATASESLRRSIFSKVLRNTRDPFLAAFDLPDRMNSSPSRNVTTSPSQSLLLINGDWTLKRAAELAKRVRGDGTLGIESQLREAFMITVGRVPEEEELSSLVRYLDQAEQLEESQTSEPQPQIGTQVLEVTDGKQAPAARTADSAGLPGNQFTIQATLFLRSLYADATVRTIASHWDSSPAHPGWALGVTSTKSAYQPRNLILQFVGKNSAGVRKYEVVPSGIHLELNRPYTVTAAVNLEDPQSSGVLFVVQDVMTKEIQTANVAHEVVQSEASTSPLIIGGRDQQERHKWDGWIDQVSLLSTVLSQEQILSGDFTPEPKSVVGRWDFDDSELPIRDTVHGRTLVAQGHAQTTSSALVDICHILLNSNEFIYID